MTHVRRSVDVTHVRRSVDLVQCQCGMPSHRSETVRSGPRGTQAEGPCDCGSVAYSSCMLPLKGLQDRVAVKGSSRKLVAARFFWMANSEAHFEHIACSAVTGRSEVAFGKMIDTGRSETPPVKFAILFFCLGLGVTLSHHFDRVDRCSADQRMSDVRPAWSKVNSAIR